MKGIKLNNTRNLFIIKSCYGSCIFRESQNGGVGEGGRVGGGDRRRRGQRSR